MSEQPRKNLTERHYQQELGRLGDEFVEMVKVILHDKGLRAATFVIPFAGGQLNCNFQKSNGMHFFEFYRQISTGGKSGAKKHVLAFDISPSNGPIINPRVDGQDSAFDKSCRSDFLLALEQVKAVLLLKVREIEAKQVDELHQQTAHTREALKHCLSRPVFPIAKGKPRK